MIVARQLLPGFRAEHNRPVGYGMMSYGGLINTEIGKRGKAGPNPSRPYGTALANCFPNSRTSPAVPN